ncbi:unnamed protein product [Closterium sp. Naga37s-1]|nr:unnamed protein product [Closterium sp. Naga37s-1]CAI5528661.1 unnamed protein product [Closterium sp. Naga37s-1]
MDQKPAVPGLDRATIRSFPVFTYRGSDGLDGLGSDGLLMAEDSRSGYPAPLPRRPGRAERLTRECAVCLGEYAAGERIKVVPACAHGFHADCIDLWLAAKTTCPICRRDLTPVKASSIPISRTNSTIPTIPTVPTQESNS